MKLEPIGSNVTVITLKNGNKYLFSYETPVAKLVANTLFVTNEDHSVTTKKHIKKWMNILGRKPYEKTFTYQEIISKELEEI